MVGYASAGTGFSGILATGTLLLVVTYQFPKHLLFMIELPTIVIYYHAFKWLVNQKEQYPFDHDNQCTFTDSELVKVSLSKDIEGPFYKETSKIDDYS